MGVEFERHPGTYNEELDFFMFYGLVFESIFDVAEILRRLPYDPTLNLTGEYHRGYKFLLDEDSGMLWTGFGWLPDESFVDDFIRKIKHRHRSDDTD